MANRIPEVSPVLDEAGLPLHGFCRFEEIRPYLLSCRAASRIPAAACTVIIALFPYRFPDDGGPRNLSLYACVPDYHRVAGDVLRRAAGQLARCYPVFVFEPFIDNSPIPEVRAASLSGLGRIGDPGRVYRVDCHKRALARPGGIPLRLPALRCLRGGLSRALPLRHLAGQKPLPVLPHPKKRRADPG